jgi:two-component system invasion response regulator UvrY
MNERPIRILLVDDHPLVRMGFRHLLETAPEITVVGEAGNGEEGCELAAVLDPDVILLDISMPGMGGIEALGRLGRVARATRIVVVSVHENEPFPTLCLERGASAYVSKRCPPEEIITAVREVSAGRLYVSSDIARRMALERVQGDAKRLAALSPREFEVFSWLARGRSVSAVAQAMSLSPKTVHVHRANLLRKLGIRTTAELVRLAIRNGIAEVSPQ